MRTSSVSSSSYLRLPPGSEGCCYCALKAFFDAYALSEDAPLPTDVLRAALALTYTTRGRFKAGSMEDSTEAIEALFEYFHAAHLCNEGWETSSPPPSPSSGSLRRLSDSAERIEAAGDLVCTPPCIAHEIFGIEYLDVTRCTFCGSTGEPAVQVGGSTFLYRAYVAEILFAPTSQSPREERETPSMCTEDTFGMHPLPCVQQYREGDLQELLRQACQVKVDGKCNECNSLRTVLSERWLTRAPRVFLLSLIWPAAEPPKELLTTTLNAIRTRVRLRHIFRAPEDTGAWGGGAAGADSEDAEEAVTGDNAAHVFRSMICYCGRHYIAVTWCPERLHWLLFDDERVLAESEWTGVSKLLSTRGYVPTLLFFERLTHRERAESLAALDSQLCERSDGYFCTVA
eukprot:NODE_9277_length_1435_cov_4.714067.p1 GENE.NODE_9277_length_1435_cov_4.714067~~NODE_9277_length_1435_cov_4.714067.p1  ORF type:complete len:401 (-),score=140.66 NODE_9277_length_1435_cov_4.714067:233-1435(-)